MDTRVFCVYNLARRVFLSSKVTVADGENQPLKVLKVMVSGLALDAESGLWLNPLKSTPTVPRLFPFDLIYLDQDHCILEMVEVLAGVEFPSYRREVASAIVLPLDTLRSTQTHRGDQLVVCLLQEADQLIPAVQPVHATAEPVEEGPALHSSAQTERPATAEANETASETVPEVVDHRIVLASARVEGSPAVNDEQQIQAREVRARETEAQQIGAAAGLTAQTVPAHQQEATPIGEEHLSEIPDSTPVKFSITEAEKSRTPTTTPVIEDGDEVEDLFANWVESPHSTSALIGRRVRPTAAEVDAAAQKALASTALAQSQAVNGQETKSETSSPSKVEAVASEMTEVAGKVEQPAEVESNSVSETFLPAPATELTTQPSTAQPGAATEAHGPGGQADHTEQEGSSSPHPGANSPVKVATPQPSRTVSFTVAQYGMWKVSAPTALTSRVVPPAKADVEATTDRISGKTNATAASIKGETSSPEAAVTSSAASEVVSSPIQKDPVPESIAKADHTALEQNDLRVSESTTESTVQVAPPATDRIQDFESRLANAVTNAAAVWSRGSSEETSLEAAPHVVRSQEQEDNTESDWRTERIVEATGKPAPAEFAALVQEKLDRLQTRANDGPVEPFAITPTPVIEKAIAEKANAVSEEASGVMGRGAAPADDPSKTRPVGLSSRLRSWLTPAPQLASDRRRAHRRYVPGMVAHYFTGGAPKPYDVADISMTGFYVLTEDRWTPDTMVRMTLQKALRQRRKEAVHYGPVQNCSARFRWCRRRVCHAGVARSAQPRCDAI